MNQDRHGSPNPRRDRSSDLSTHQPAASPTGTLASRRSSPRANGFDYVGGYRYHVTMVTANRRRHLVGATALQLIELFVDLTGIHAFDPLAYCVMPDHAHFLVAGDAERESSLPRLMHALKQRSGYAFKQATGTVLWQRSYHDHVLRPDEPSWPHAEYILLNPVRAGLVEDARDWPFSGPQSVFDVSHAGADRSEEGMVLLTHP